MKFGRRGFWRTLKRILKRKKRYKPEKERYAGRIDMTNEMIFRKVTRSIMEDKLYLLPDLTINDLADQLGTNRTYVSRAFSAHNEGFVNYLTRVRVEKLHGYLLSADEEGRVLEDGEDLAMVSGFLNKRAMMRAVKKVDGKTLGQLKRECRESDNSLTLPKQ